MPRARRLTPSSTKKTLHASGAALALALVFACGCRGCGESEPVVTPPAARAPQPLDEPEGTVDALTPPPPVRPPDLALDPRTMNGHPEGPKQDEFDRIHAEGQQKVQVCVDKLPPGAIPPGTTARLMIRYEVGNEGKTAEISVTGELPSETLACGKAAIEGLTFPRFEGTGIRNSYNLNYSRGAAPDLATTR